MKKQSFVLAACALGVMAVACSNKVDMGEYRPGRDSPTFTGTPDGGDGGGLPPDNTTLACIGTVCPEGFGTCLSGPFGTAPQKCGTDLMRDSDNCGACGKKCGKYFPLHMTSRCVDGACEVQCYSPAADIGAEAWRDCNSKLADGCEVDINHDRENCGSCGNVCPDGVSCIDGKCGCPPGLTECGEGNCVDLMNSDSNCGSCGNFCFFNPTPDECRPRAPHTTYGCFEGTCGHLRCEDNWIDCDNDIPRLNCASNGCEAPAGVENCGECGHKCAEYESCFDDGECGIPCVKDKKVLCGDDCVDVLNDVNACGACGIVCPTPGPHGKRTCEKGVCTSECLDGWADCNGDPGDGCEVNLLDNPENCGACGTRCDVAAGQPCIEGKCLMVDCSFPGAK